MTVSPAEILAHVRAQLETPLPPRIGIAVSGGSDSMALLLALKQALADTQVELRAATVDHRLRRESTTEAQQVAAAVQDLGVAHDILTWETPTRSGNLQDQARRARYDLLSQWARAYGIGSLALGHTADDQAETLVMRLSRGAGVTGLSGMAPRRMRDGICLLRPLLGLSRADLRAFLTQAELRWVDDPSNEDPRFDRIRIRQAMDLLSDLGLTSAALSQVADNMSQAHQALTAYSNRVAVDLVTCHGTALRLDRPPLAGVPDEILHRILAHAIKWLTGTGYPPRRLPMKQAVAAARDGQSLTLSGCRLVPSKTHIWICREARALQDLDIRVDQLWDQNWQVIGPEINGLSLRILGEEGLKSCPDWRDTGVPRPVLMAAPGVWREDILVAAPMAGLNPDWQLRLKPGAAEFHASLLSH